MVGFSGTMRYVRSFHGKLPVAPPLNRLHARGEYGPRPGRRAADATKYVSDVDTAVAARMAAPGAPPGCEKAPAVENFAWPPVGLI